MFNELPGFFDRNFIIAFFLPALLFVLVGLGLMTGFDIESSLTKTITDDLYKGATIIGVISWVIGVLLLSVNFKILRLFEGYGSYNPLKLLKPVQKRKFFQIEEKKLQLRDALAKAQSLGDEEEVAKINAQRIDLHQRAADRYPPNRSRVLPTAFGNAVRAFEDYPEQMYGLDAIVSWVRLLAVIPKDFREMISSARSQVDMWMNFRLLSYILLIGYAAMVFFTQELRMAWFPIAVLIFAYLASVRSTGAAVLWGDFVKASYDLYLPDLREQIRLPETETVEDEIQLWNKFARQVLYHDKDNVLQRVAGKKDSQKGDKDSMTSED